MSNERGVTQVKMQDPRGQLVKEARDGVRCFAFAVGQDDERPTRNVTTGYISGAKAPKWMMRQNVGAEAPTP
jgi:hypothetical protein